MKKALALIIMLNASPAASEWRYGYNNGMDNAYGTGTVVENRNGRLEETGEKAILFFGCQKGGAIIIMEPNTDIRFDDRWEHKTEIKFESGQEATLTWHIADNGMLWSQNQEFVVDVMKERSAAFVLDQTKGAWFDLTNSFRTIARAVRECVR